MSVDIETGTQVEQLSLRDELDAAREEIANLQVALKSSRTTGAAMGILMAVRHISMDEAFAQLCQASQETQRKLRVIAEDVVLTGTV